MKYQNWLLIKLCIITFCAASFVIVLLTPKQHGYEFFSLMPAAYLFFFLLVFRGRVRRELPLFFVALSFFGFLRYVAFPPLVVISNHYGGRSWVEPLSGSYHLGVLLIVYELFVFSLVLFLIENSKTKKKLVPGAYSDALAPICEKRELPKAAISFSVVLLFFILSLVLLGLFPRGIFYINFLFPSAVTHDDLDALATADKIAVYLFIVSKQLLCIHLLLILSEKYRRNKSGIYVFLGLSVVLVNTVIYMGTNRTQVIIMAVVSLYFFAKLYGKSVARYGVGFSVVVIFLVSIISSEREIAPVHNEKMAELADKIQVYTGGVYNAAISVETKDWYPEASDPKVFFYDFVRPLIGVNVIVKEWDINYSNIYFNYRMWTHVDRRSQIMPMIGQGYLHLGFIFAPLLGVLFLLFYYVLERYYILSSSVEVKYFILLAMTRLGMIFGQNSMNIVNYVSMNLVMFFILLVAGVALKKILAFPHSTGRYPLRS